MNHAIDQHGLPETAPEPVEADRAKPAGDSREAAPARRARRRPGSGVGTREVVLGWCLWLIGSWGTVLVGGSNVPTTGPVHRWMSLMAVVGACAVWPAVRLSQEARDAWDRPVPRGLARRSVLLDWAAINLVFQAVLWPMAFVGQWSVAQAVMLGITLAAWSLLAGLIVAWGRVSPSGRARTGAMAACLAVLLLEPLALFLVGMAGGGGWADLPDLRLSPLQATWAFSGPPARFAFVEPAFVDRVLGVAAAAALGWGIFLALGPRPGERR